MLDRPSGAQVGAESANPSLVRLVTSRDARSTTQISPTPPCSAANATFVPSGEISGDSGSSTVRSSTRWSTFRFRTFWRISVRHFSARTKYATWSPDGDHDIHGTV